MNTGADGQSVFLCCCSASIFYFELLCLIRTRVRVGWVLRSDVNFTVVQNTNVEWHNGHALLVDRSSVVADVADVA